MKNLISESNEEMLENFIIKNNFSKSYPYFYKIIDVKHNPNKIFYILIRSIDDISNIKKYFPNSNMFPYNAEHVLKPYWKGRYNKEKINSYDFVEFDNLENENKIIVPFEKKSCIVEIHKTVLKIDMDGNKVGEEDFFTYKIGNNYFLEGFSSDKFLKINHSQELMFFTSNSIGSRILVISEKLNNKKYYGITDQKNSFFIPLNYEKYELKEDYIFLYSYPNLKLIKNKNGFDYYVATENKNEDDAKITKFNISTKSVENQDFINSNNFKSLNGPDNIYISDFNETSIQNLIKYIVARKYEIKILTFIVILNKIRKENLKLKYDKNLFDLVDATIRIEPELIQGAYCGYTKKSCYLATHIYQDINHPNVEYFRNYRDDVLNKYFLGRIFIKYYYKYSPSLVLKLKNKTVFNNVIKTFLDMVIVLIK